MIPSEATRKGRLFYVGAPVVPLLSSHGSGAVLCEVGAAAIREENEREEKAMHDLEIVYLPPGDLTPYENNARKHAPHDIDAIIASIEEVGFSDPIGIWSDKNIIVEGHGRQIAALQMGLSRVPCIRLDHMTDEQRRAYALAHNKTAELSEWDFGKLEEELAHLQIDGIDMTKFDFDLSGIGGGGFRTYTRR